MEDIKIPHAEKAYVDRSLSPVEVLRVFTKLPEHSASKSDAEARDEMLAAIAKEVAERRLDYHRVHWSASDDVNRP
jgi:hypothetical protein